MKADIGDIVEFYLNADLHAQPHVGIVEKCTEGGLADIRLLNARVAQVFRGGARHVSDPALKERPHTREDGAWDFAPHIKQLKALAARKEK
jgi:hypothetical protein